MKRTVIAMSALALNLAACATVTKGTTDKVKVNTEPPEAKVVFEEVVNKYDGARCTTPCEVELNRKGNYRATVTKSGYEPFQVVLIPKVSASGATAMAGNILVGGVVGAGIDAATGAMKDLSPNPLTVMLAPKGGESYMVDKDGNRIDAVIGEKGTVVTEEAYEQYENMTEEEKKKVQEQIAGAGSGVTN